MLAVGFDPSFIDTLVRVEDAKGNLVDDIPPLGHHHRQTNIIRVAGGNGVNISAILHKLNIDHILVVPSNPEFDILLNKRNIDKVHRIHEQVNESVGITFHSGEMQFNDGKHGLSRIDWSEEVHRYWTESPISLFTNWGLNPTSSDWVSRQWLASCGYSFEEISQISDVKSQALQAEGCKTNLLLEPGSIISHKDHGFLLDLLDHIGSTTFENQFSIFSANEEENPEFNKLNFRQSIFHSSSKVILSEGGIKSTFDVNPLPCTPTTFVGSGDAFIAGLIKGLQEMRLDIDFAIHTAQRFLCNSF